MRSAVLFLHRLDRYGATRMAKLVWDKVLPDCFDELSCRLPRQWAESDSDIADEWFGTIVPADISTIRAASLWPSKWPATLRGMVRTAAALRAADVQRSFLYVNSVTLSVIPLLLMMRRHVRGIWHIHEVPRSFVERVIGKVLFTVSPLKVVYAGSYMASAWGDPRERRGKVVHNPAPLRPSGRTVLQPRQYQRGERLDLLFVGRICESKGIFDLLAALPVLHERVGVPVMLTILGDFYGEDVSLRSRFEQCVAEVVGNEVNVVFGGFVEDLTEHYAKAHLLVIPSKSEDPFPLVALEGVSTGIPTCVARHSGLLEIANALSIPHGIRSVTPTGIAMAIEEMINDRNLYATFNAVRDRAARQYGEAGFVQSMKVVVQEAGPENPAGAEN